MQVTAKNHLGPGPFGPHLGPDHLGPIWAPDHLGPDHLGPNWAPDHLGSFGPRAIWAPGPPSPPRGGAGFCQSTATPQIQDPTPKLLEDIRLFDADPDKSTMIVYDPHQLLGGVVLLDGADPEKRVPPS